MSHSPLARVAHIGEHQETFSPEETFSFEHVHPQYYEIALNLAQRILNSVGSFKKSKDEKHKPNLFDNKIGYEINNAFWARMKVREISKRVRSEVIITTKEMLYAIDQQIAHQLLQDMEGIDKKLMMGQLLDVSGDVWNRDAQKAQCLELLKLDLFWRELNLANRGANQSRQ